MLAITALAATIGVELVARLTITAGMTSIHLLAAIHVHAAMTRCAIHVHATLLLELSKVVIAARCRGREWHQHKAEHSKHDD